MKKHKFVLRIRDYGNGRFVDVWMIRRWDTSECCLLYGPLVPKAAEELAEALGWPVERESRPGRDVVPVKSPLGHTAVENQKTLFG